MIQKSNWKTTAIYSKLLDSIVKAIILCACMLCGSALKNDIFANKIETLLRNSYFTDTDFRIQQKRK